jgi:AcrR family transcriptional regulator
MIDQSHNLNMDSEFPDRGAKKRTLRERFREETAREILIAAEQVFTEQGLSGAAMSMIAERAGVAVGTLYNRFKDREALLGALLDDRREELLERLDEALAEVAAEDLRTRLHAFVLTLLLEVEEHRPFLRLVFASEHAQSGREKTPRALRERLDTLWKSAQASRQLRRDSEQSFSGLLLAMVKGTMDRERYGLPALEPAAAAALIVDFFMRGAGR